MLTDATPSLEVQEKQSRGSWTRVDSAALDVLDVESVDTREWAFAWRGRVVLQPLGGRVSEASYGWLGADDAVVAGCRAAPIRIHARAGSAFRVIFEEPSAPSDALSFRVEAPRVLTVDARAPSDAAFAEAMAALRRAEPVSRRIPPALAHARRYIEQHADEDFDLETLSRAVGTGRCHLCRSFSRAFGLPPYRFRAQLRVARARELLMEGLGCSDVAHAVGFCDQSHLSRFFKDLTGTTPGAYARAVARARPRRALAA